MSKIALFAFGLVAVPGLATAADRAAPAVTAASAPAAAPKEKLYCIKYDDVTGSRVAAQECRTKAQWARRGISVEGRDAKKS